MYSFINRSTVWRQLPALWLVAWMSLPPVVWGNPSGGTVSSGSAQITTAPGNVTINQSSQRAIIKWNDFSINQGEKTTFVQPNSQSATLNRVTGGSASHLNGALNANGKVYLVNPNGVVIGKTGRVNTAGFTASTHDVTDADFNGGGDMTFRGNSKASVINHGKIRATEGDVTLIARQVENHGTLSAKKGSVNLAGGTEVLIKPNGEQRVYIRGGNGSVANTGSIRATAAELRAAGGNEYALAVNNSGTVRATRVDRSGGRIVLRAESGITQNSGSLIARSDAPGKNGGRIDVQGSRVALTKTSRLDAGSTYGKGGTVNVGGGFQGKDAALKNAEVTVVEKGSTLNVDGGTQGGSAIVWSDLATGFYGDISAQGPGLAHAGTGGFVEVSSKGYLDFNGGVRTAGGTLLLDPSNITITFVDANPAVVGTGITLTTPFTSTAADSTLNAVHLESLLSAGTSVIVATSGSFDAAGGLQNGITGDAGAGASGDIHLIGYNLSWNSAASLTLLAHDDIILQSNILNSGTGSLNIVAGWDGDLGASTSYADIVGRSAYGFFGNLTNSSGAVPNNGGSVFLNAGLSTVSIGSRDGTTNVAGYDVVLQGAGANRIAKIGHPNGRSDININGRNNVSVLSGFGANSYAQIGHGSLLTAGDELSGNIFITTGGFVQVLATNGNNAYAQIGHGGRGSIWTDVAGLIYIATPSGLLISAGSNTNNYAQVGHGGNDFNSDSINGNISINAFNVTVAGGLGEGAYAMLGHGGAEADIAGRIAGHIEFAPTTQFIIAVAGTNSGTYAQIGHGGYDCDTGLDINGYIILNGSREVTVQANDYEAYAQIGHGGLESESAGLYGNIVVGTSTTSRVSVLGGSGYIAYAQIGHGGTDSENSESVLGDITVRGNIISVLAGRTAKGEPGDNYAQIGHGGHVAYTEGSITGNISVLGQSITVQGGDRRSAEGNYALIGHGGDSSDSGSITGNITVTHTTALTITGGGAFNSWAQIGHGGTADVGGCGCGSGGITGLITVTGTGNITMTGGSREGSYVQIGHGGGGTISSFLTGNIKVSGNNISVIAGDDGLTYAHIGHDFSGGFSLGYITGDIDLTFGQNLLVFGGTDRGGSFAQIGHGGTVPIPGVPFPLASSITGDITITGAQGSSVLVTAGDGCNCFPANYALIGHGGQGLILDPFTSGGGFITGNISLDAGSLFLQGGTFRDSFAQVGHAIPAIDTSFLPPGLTFATTLTGHITLNLSEDLTMAGGTKPGTFTLIGHGSRPAGGSNGIRSGQIIIRVGGETSLAGGTRNRTDWWIGHRTGDRDLITDADVFFQTGTLDYDILGLSDAATVNERFAQMMAVNLKRGNFTLLSTNTQGGLVIAAADPNPDRQSAFTLSLLSKGNLTIDAPITNTGTGASLFLVAGFDGTSGILAQAGAPLVDTSLFTAPSTGMGDIEINSALTFGNDMTLVAGRSILIDFDGVLSAGDEFLAIVDNFNATRPDFNPKAYFYNLGTIRSRSASLYAVAPELVILGTFGGLGTRSLADIWYGDTDAIQGANYKLAQYPVPPDPPEPPRPPEPEGLPTLDTSDNPDDRLRKVERLRTNQRFSIYYSQTAGYTAAQRARLWLSSFNVIPAETMKVSGQ